MQSDSTAGIHHMLLINNKSIVHTPTHFSIIYQTIYGNNPKKLLNIIIENNEMKIKDLPLLIFLYPIKVLNSLY